MIVFPWLLEGATKAPGRRDPAYTLHLGRNNFLSTGFFPQGVLQQPGSLSSHLMVYAAIGDRLALIMQSAFALPRERDPAYTLRFVARQKSFMDFP